MQGIEIIHYREENVQIRYNTYHQTYENFLFKR